jgi:hypothetical protein
MKRNSTILFLLISLNALAQFPAPTNFSLQGHYVELDRCEHCIVYYHDLCGPTYCSSFSWQAPTETTTATFDHYNIYGKYENQIVFSATETTISHWAQIPPLGDFWVTAVYTNPSGESLPSNVVTGWEVLPTSNSKVQSIIENIIFSSIEQTLMVNSNKTIMKMNLINSNGRLIKCIQNPSRITNISELPKGFYIVEVYCKNTDVLRQKIIK